MVIESTKTVTPNLFEAVLFANVDIIVLETLEAIGFPEMDDQEVMERLRVSALKALNAIADDDLAEVPNLHNYLRNCLTGEILAELDKLCARAGWPF